MIYICIFVRYIRYRRYATLETAVCATLLVMALVEDYASVTYNAKETYFYLMLGFLETEKLRRTCRASLPQMLTLQDARKCSGRKKPALYMNSVIRLLTGLVRNSEMNF